MDSFDVVVVGSMIIDFISYVSRLPRTGETIHGRKLVTGFGGKGCNQCVAARKLGSQVAMVGRLGNDVWGTEYVQHLKKLQINTEFIVQQSDQSTGFAQINVADNGDNQIIITAGANNSLNKLDVDKAKYILLKSTVLLCQLETPIEATAEALRTFSGISILNAAPAVDELPFELISLPTILCVNEIEAALISKTEIKNINDSFTACKRLKDFGAKTVIITLGGDGVTYQTPDMDTCCHLEAVKVDNVVDTTGAGDGFLGALAHKLAQDKSIQNLADAINFAQRVASISVQRPGTQSSYCTNEEI